MTESKSILHLDDKNFETEISKGVTLVDFYADWCGPCRMMAPLIEKLAEEMGSKAKIAKLDIEIAQETASKLQVTSIPTLVVFKEGKEIKRIVGLKDLEFLRNLLTSNL